MTSYAQPQQIISQDLKYERRQRASTLHIAIMSTVSLLQCTARPDILAIYFSKNIAQIVGLSLSNRFIVQLIIYCQVQIQKQTSQAKNQIQLLRWHAFSLLFFGTIPLPFQVSFYASWHRGCLGKQLHSLTSFTIFRTSLAAGCKTLDTHKPYFRRRSMTLSTIQSLC